MRKRGIWFCLKWPERWGSAQLKNSGDLVAKPATLSPCCSYVCHQHVLSTSCMPDALRGASPAMLSSTFEISPPLFVWRSCSLKTWSNSFKVAQSWSDPGPSDPRTLLLTSTRSCLPGLSSWWNWGHPEGERRGDTGKNAKSLLSDKGALITIPRGIYKYVPFYPHQINNEIWRKYNLPFFILLHLHNFSSDFLVYSYDHQVTIQMSPQ